MTLPGAVRDGYMSYVRVYEGEDLGGPPRKKFVEGVRAEGAPLSADRYSQISYTYGMLHQAPIFTTLDRRSLGGGCYDQPDRGLRTSRKFGSCVCSACRGSL